MLIKFWDRILGTICPWQKRSYTVDIQRYNKSSLHHSPQLAQTSFTLQTGSGFFAWTWHSLLSSLISSHFLHFLCAASRWMWVWVKAWALSVLSERRASKPEDFELLLTKEPLCYLEYSFSLRWSVGFYESQQHRCFVFAWRDQVNAPCW